MQLEWARARLHRRSAELSHQGAMLGQAGSMCCLMQVELQLGAIERILKSSCKLHSNTKDILEIFGPLLRALESFLLTHTHLNILVETAPSKWPNAVYTYSHSRIHQKG